MSVPAVDDSRWPVVHVLFPETVTLDELSIFTRLLERVIAARGPIAIINDIRAIDPSQATSLHRRVAADATDKMSREGGIVCVANIVNDRTRPLLQQVHWERMHHHHPIGIFEDSAKAEDWMREMLRETTKQAGDAG